MIEKIKIPKELRANLYEELDNIDYTMVQRIIQIDSRFDLSILTTAASQLNQSAIQLLCESLTSSNQEVRQRLESLAKKVAEIWSNYPENLFLEAKEKMLIASKAGCIDAKRFIQAAENNK